MRLLDSRTASGASFATTVERTSIGPRKAYRIEGVVVCAVECGREMLVQWKCRDDTWMQGTFVVPNDAVTVVDDGDLANWKTARPTDLEPGDEVTIDYLPLGPQNLALVIRRGLKESALEAKNTAEILRAPDEGFCSSMVDVALPRVAEKKACA
jgi:hypothetical protein